MKKIEIMGCGYIGLPTAITFTLAGYEVCGFDVKDTVVDTLNAGHIHIVEPGLQDAMTKAMATGRLHFTTKPEPADVFIICVQTPYRETEEHKRALLNPPQGRSALFCARGISACSNPPRLPTPRAWWRRLSLRCPALHRSSL